jgi:hypothetical protein
MFSLWWIGIKWVPSGSSKYIHVASAVLREGTAHSTAFSDVLPCSLAQVHRCFQGTYCLHFQGQKVTNPSKQQADICSENGSRQSYETSVKFYHTAQCHILSTSCTNHPLSANAKCAYSGNQILYDTTRLFNLRFRK